MYPQLTSTCLRPEKALAQLPYRQRIQFSRYTHSVVAKSFITKYMSPVINAALSLFLPYHFSRQVAPAQHHADPAVNATEHVGTVLQQPLVQLLAVHLFIGAKLQTHKH